MSDIKQSEIYVIVIGTGARNRQEGAIDVMTLGDAPIAVSSKVKSLGITLDGTLSFDSHIDNQRL